MVLTNLAAEGGQTPAALSIAAQIGIAIAKLHDDDVVHGDLTTSNLMVHGAPDEEEVVQWSTPAHALWADAFCARQVVIDFGLASSQPLPEDKAVDLYVLERAFISTHPNSQPLVSTVFATAHSCHIDT